MSVAETMEPDLGEIDPNTIPLDRIDVSNSELYERNLHLPYFERLRREDPVHYTADSAFGAYWSATKYNDIVSIETNHRAFSSVPVIVIGDLPEEYVFPQFIAMDPPRHDVQRKTVSPAVSPAQLMELEPLIRERVGKILDGLPIGEEFNWVDRVSIELTTQMLATLFDFPFEDRRLLPYWSDVATSSPGLTGATNMTEDERVEELHKCLAYFTELWHQRAGKEPQMDFISLLAHGEHTRDMVNDPREFLGNLILLIVGGNDTTRNSISGGVLALNQHPAEYEKLRANPDLIPNMVSEIIRWQTPLSHMRRTCVEDTEVGGKLIRAGEKIVMWYVSGNRDGDVIERPDEFIIDRENARRHLSFGFGIHRCMGNRLAEMQLRIVWEEIMKRFSFVEVVGPETRVRSNFVLGYQDLPVVLHAK